MNDVLWWAAQNAVATALLVPVVWLTARLRRSRPAEQHLLWLLLLVKLLTPPVIFWPWSADEIKAWLTTHDDGAAHESPSISVTDGPSVEVGVVVSLDPLPAMPAGVPEAVTSASVFPQSSPVAFDPPPIVGRKPETADAGIAASQIVGLLWLAGAVVVCLRSGVHVRTQRRIVRTAYEAPSELRSLVEAASSRLGIGRVAVRVSDRSASPFISCLGKPVLVWPAALAHGESIASCEGVIAHELAHVRRRDHWVAWLEAVAAPLWWWNPVFWYVRQRLDETRELACDSLAVELTASDRRAFAELLLAFSSSGQPALPFAPLRTGIAPRHSLRRRLAMLFDKRVSGRVSFAGITLSLLFAAVALPGWAWSQEEPSDPLAPSEDVAPVAPASIPATVPSAENQPTQPVQSRPAETPAAPAAPPAPQAPTTRDDVGYEPPPMADLSSRTQHEIEIGDGRLLRLTVMPDGKGILLFVTENGKTVHAQLLTGLSIAGTSAEPEKVPDDAYGSQPSPAAPHGPRHSMTPGLGGFGQGGAHGGGGSFPRQSRPSPPTQIHSGPSAAHGGGSSGSSRMPHISLSQLSQRPAASETDIKLLKNALQLALLEVEEKKVLLEQAREENKRQQALFETGATSERPRDLRLLEIELKKAELQAEQARIRLEAAEAEREPGFRREEIPPTY